VITINDLVKKQHFCPFVKKEKGPKASVLCHLTTRRQMQKLFSTVKNQIIDTPIEAVIRLLNLFKIQHTA
jgi:hypothetical protein